MVPPFVAELIRAAHQVPRLTHEELARLLRRAAATIRDFREQITSSENPAHDRGQGDIVFDLSAKAEVVDLYPAEKISNALLDAAEVIKACRVLLGTTRDVEGQVERKRRRRKSSLDGVVRDARL